MIEESVNSAMLLNFTDFKRTSITNGETRETIERYYAKYEIPEGEER